MLPLLFSSSRWFSVRKRSRLTKLNPFGFDNESIVNIEIQNKTSSNIYIFLVEPQDSIKFKHEINSVSKNYDFEKQNFHFSYFAKTNLTEKGENLTIRINEKSTMTPFIYNPGLDEFRIKLTYKNPRFLFDSRDQIIPIFLAYESIAFLVCALSFLVNQFLHMEFRITVHTSLMAAAFIKSLCCIFEAYVWKAINNFQNCKNLSIIAVLSYNLSNIFLLVINVLAVFGWGIYKKGILFNDAMCATAYSCVYTFLHFFAEIDGFLRLPIVMAFVYVSILFGQYILESVYKSEHLFSMFSTDVDQMVPKIRMSIKFTTGIFSIVVIFSIISCCFLLTTCPNSLILILKELLILCILVTDMKFFFFDDKFVPFKAADCEMEAKPVYVMEPNGNEIYFVSDV